MTDDERKALLVLIEGTRIVDYPMLLRLERLGLAVFVRDDRFGEWYPTDEGRKAVEDQP